MDIIYRTYLPGDEQGLADVFNSAFQTEGAGLLRLPGYICWRYINRPGFNPDEIQIAEDATTKKIVGSIFSTIETHRFDSKEYKVGAINDVGVDPAYAGNQIIRKLLEQAIAFMKTQGCKASVLCADPKGRAREKLYLKAGYKDYLKQHFWILFGNLRTLVRHLPLFLPALPAFAFYHGVLHVKRLFFNKKLKAKGYSVQIVHPPQSVEYSDKLYPLYKNAMKAQYDGFVDLSSEEWNHYRNKGPIASYQPSYIIIRNRGKIAGFASFSRHFIYATKLGLRFPLAYLRDFLIDPKSLPDLNHLDMLEQTLAVNLWYGLLGRKCMAGMFSTTPHYAGMNRALHSTLAINPMSGTYMLKSFLPDDEIPATPKKPYFISPGDFATFP